jgi:DNA-directed RNA polymerase subunit RPC12/RpoP
MRLADAIVITGAIESEGVVINDLVEDKRCAKCGQLVKTAAGVTLTSVLNIRAGEEATCPHCSGSIT